MCVFRLPTSKLNESSLVLDFESLRQNIRRMQLFLKAIDFRTNNIHLLDRTETNIIFIWSGKVILGEAKPSPNITLPDQINMILGEVLSNKCFIIPATFCAPGPSHALLIQTKRSFTRYQCAPVQVCVLRRLFSNVEFYCVRTGYGVMDQVSSISNLMNV